MTLRANVTDNGSGVSSVKYCVTTSNTCTPNQNTTISNGNVNVPLGNNSKELFLKGGFYLVNKVEIASVNTSQLPILTNKEKEELFIKIKLKKKILF